VTDLLDAEDLLVKPFPGVGRLMRVAYRELDIAATGTAEQAQILGDPRLLPRPWDPATCLSAALRTEVWDWLDAVVTWLNHEYTWDVNGTIPSCWPHHPHLVREIAVLADQRRTAELALTSDLLEDWHRYSLPSFTHRLHARLRTHCEDGHQPWPAKGRHARHTAEPGQTDRRRAFTADISQPLVLATEALTAGAR
jgi:hypothetical protein